jgi:hypothetical protein
MLLIFCSKNGVSEEQPNATRSKVDMSDLQKARHITSTMLTAMGDRKLKSP